MNAEVNGMNVEFVYLPVINFAMQQNRVSLIRRFSIENTTEEPLKDVRIRLIAEPGFADSEVYPVEVIPVGENIQLSSFKLNLSTGFFTQLTERITGHFILEITVGDEPVFKQVYPIDILAFDQWGGITVLPEMLSSFITPNHPAIIPIIQRASVVLEKWTGNPSLNNYQSRNPNRVRQQMAAIYTAISELEIIYSTSPASFEEYGQRVRLVDAVLGQKMGNCLDMSLLYASCLEYAGIHSLIVITHGHAFTGAWLVPETFPDSIIDDVSFLTKRIADGINEITLVEATLMNKGNNVDFDQAAKTADNQLANPASFILALDVQRSRFAGIRPIPQRILNGQQWEIKEEEIPTLVDKSENTPGSINPYDLSGISKEIEVTKQLLWERKLLDLSLRNNLLNIRITKNTLQLLSVDLDRFEDALADGEEFRILPKPTDWDNPLYNFGLYQSPDSSDPIIELVKSELTQKRLRSFLTETELTRALHHIYRSSRLSLEENGANTLYLALGLLKWYETPGSERPRYAPILLLPVEIIRKSAAKGYIIRSREEESMMNITLLEMLRQNFGISISGLDPLPVDGSGINVKLIYSIIRNSIKDQRKWDVEEQAILGIFSFNKFIMWNDIHNNSHKLVENKIVSSLMNGKLEWEVDEDMADAGNFDKELLPTDIVLPISADSSQLEAIFEAVNDKTYILHGPPGTGKSQTITNIIANALYKGKRVLFVAEKMAALSVVQSRLEAIGLNPFCLELHSNKTKKSAILSQLRTTTEIVKKTSPEDYARQAARLHQLRNELNTYIETLHKKYPFRISLYDAITRYLSINCDIEVDFPQALIKSLEGDETIVEWRDAVEALVSVGNACGHPYNHPLTGIRINSYSAGIKEEITKGLTDTITLLSKVKSKTSILTGLFGESETAFDKRQMDIVSQILTCLLQIPELTSALLKLPRMNEALEEYREVIVHGKERDKIKSNIRLNYTDEILSVNVRQLLTEWNKYSNQWFLPKFFGQRKIKKRLNVYALNNVIATENVKPVLTQIIKYQAEDTYLQKYTASLPMLFGKYGKNGNEQWDIIEQIIDHTSTLNSLILNYTKDIAATAHIKETIARQLSEGIAPFKSIYGNSLNELNTLLNELRMKEAKLTGMLGIQTGSLYNDSTEWIDYAIDKLSLWLTNIDKLKDWYQWLSVSDRLDQLGIGFIAFNYKEKNFPTNSLPDIFNKSFYHTAIHYIISQEPNLELFKGKIFNDIIERYKQLVAHFEDLTKKELYAKLASNIPSFTREAAQNSEVGILQRNIKNNGRATPIRKLFDQIPTFLSRMCPCMLMSPISVAQYIDPEADKFDLVVFDEASQMPTYEAVGAIARGKNIIIVGDPKQMPPTSFFSVSNVDEDNIEMEDLESILDDCLALSMPSKYLLWHYRSKHESLIAFSNSEYYENKLLTFPSPDNIESKVRLIHVDGFYDKGKSRQNQAEAQAVVKEIERRLSDSTLRKRSIGVVTFSAVQQTLIEDLLSDLFIFRPDLETMALECNEPLFIKNLENVQGDERDVILFSIGYGPDKEGKVSMNFGPLNRLGGERRLNVAVSRARYEMVIYATLRADQIDLNRTSSIGVAGLRRFLEYAEKGERMAIDSQTVFENNVSIESIIARELSRRGYTVHANIGCSGYKVDIGVVDKENPSNYILGILCDGENYRQTKTARDREIVQNSVLRMLGWNIIRIWTMDWWENREEVINVVSEELKNIERKRKSSTTVQAEYTPTPIPSVNLFDFNSTPTTTVDSRSPAESYEAKEIITPAHIETSYEEPYRPTLIRTQSGFSADSFFYPENKNMIISQIKKIISTEAPISRSLLCKRVLSAWEISRMGTRLDAYLNLLLTETPCYLTEHEGFTFYWTSGEQHKSFKSYRTDSNRDAADLPPEEIAIAIKEVLEQQISLPVKDLMRITAQLFGFARGGTYVDAAIQRGINEALKKEYMKIENERAIVC